MSDRVTHRVLLAAMSAAVIAGATVNIATAAPRHQSSRPPAGLTAAGRNLWEFEALIQDVFHTKAVMVRGASLNFEVYPSHAGGAGPPQSAFAWYAPVFANASGSTFHLSNSNVTNGQFGNYPELVRVAGRPVACNPDETTFLTTYGDALNLDLACMKPAAR